MPSEKNYWPRDKSRTLVDEAVNTDDISGTEL